MARTGTRAALAAVLAVAAGGAPAQDGGHAPGPEGAEAAPHWTYTGDGGPPYWGNLLEDYALCAAGRTQSPIALPDAAPTTPISLAFDYRPSSLNVVNNGHTVQVGYDAGSTLTLDGKVFAVQQFHFHAPSEHTVAGVAYPLEMHVVHRADDGSLAGVGILFDLAETDNAFLAGFWNVLPAPGQSLTIDAEVDLATAFDPAGAFVRYAGSLTTPPCTEGVTWLVAVERQSLSREQLGAFVSVVGFNARPVQPLNERAIGVAGP